jgi:hypothetical protein
MGSHKQHYGWQARRNSDRSYAVPRARLRAQVLSVPPGGSTGTGNERLDSQKSSSIR